MQPNSSLTSALRLPNLLHDFLERHLRAVIYACAFFANSQQSGIYKTARIDDNIRFFEETAESIVTAVSEHLNYRAQGQYKVGAVMFSNVYGFIGETQDAWQMISDWKL